MSERRDDTTEPLERDAPPERETTPPSYYYDDATGYELYDPSADEAGADEDEHEAGVDET
jgi:hypothetical protein